MSGAEWDARISEILALLETNNQYLLIVRDSQMPLYTEVAKIEQQIGVGFYLIIGMLCGVLAVLGVYFGAKIVSKLLGVASKWI